MALIFCKLCLYQKEELWKRNQSIVRLSFHILWRSRQLLKKRTNERVFELVDVKTLTRSLHLKCPRIVRTDRSTHFPSAELVSVQKRTEQNESKQFTEQYSRFS